ncbi:hypothetical protein PROFUN_15459 [Planoprotostelium fungivorum]|uniref:Uncharacterized protein n=1 Tax=Planoprotostelium fungivorum TaxID=1890364 RepID=A0A2P6MW18_9EUKA|nr:hypothetical protein PROFUN_15459 [Planoprotostelium fungivorum]
MLSDSICQRIGMYGRPSSQRHVYVHPPSRIPEGNKWWRTRKQLSEENKDIITWWTSNVREPTVIEVKAAARVDRLDMIDFLGWNDNHLSARHQILSTSHRRTNCSSKLLNLLGWHLRIIVAEAIAHGSKETIKACREREEWADIQLRPAEIRRIGQVGSLEMIQWMFGRIDHH